jgi:hypothetical protein
MKPLHDMENLIQRLRYVGNPEMHERVLDAVLRAAAQKLESTPAEPRSTIWRIIMKNHVRRTIAALVAIALVVLGIYGLAGHSMQSAYAIEQTLAALRQVKTVHARFNENGKTMEVWVKLDPNTGENESFCWLEPDRDYKQITTPTKTYMREGNKIRLYPYRLGNVLHFGHVLEDFQKNCKNVTIQNQVDEKTGKKIILLSGKMAEGGESPFSAVIDPDTKLLLRLDVHENGGLVIDDIRYDEPVPPGLFDFAIPPGAQVTEEPHPKDTNPWAKVQNDPRYGRVIDKGDVEAAAVQLVKDYWRAMIDKDWKTANQLRPAPGGELVWMSIAREISPLELVAVGSPEKKTAYNYNIPCQIKSQNGKIWNFQMMVWLRDINKTRSLLITGMGVSQQ